MFSYKTEIMEKGAWTTLKGWVLPFTDGDRLDEGLDSGKLNISMCDRKNAIKPFVRVRISIYDDAMGETPVDVIERVVISDVVRLRRFGTEQTLNNAD